MKMQYKCKTRFPRKLTVVISISRRNYGSCDNEMNLAATCAVRKQEPAGHRNIAIRYIQPNRNEISHLVRFSGAEPFLLPELSTSSAIQYVFIMRVSVDSCSTLRMVDSQPLYLTESSRIYFVRRILDNDWWSTVTLAHLTRL